MHVRRTTGCLIDSNVWNRFESYVNCLRSARFRLYDGAHNTLCDSIVYRTRTKANCDMKYLLIFYHIEHSISIIAHTNISVISFAYSHSHSYSSLGVDGGKLRKICSNGHHIASRRTASYQKNEKYARISSVDCVQFSHQNILSNKSYVPVTLLLIFYREMKLNKYFL